MPNSTSAAKRMRQGAKRRMRNRVTKKVIKTLSKKTMTSLASKDFNQALQDLKAASSKIDKAGARRVLHPNTAARRKSKLARAYAAEMAKSKQA
jgi:small subunit ribosomal protein S20